jgi:hypothetical protein
MNTAENTWRTVAGLKPIQSWKCRFGWHRWTSYEIIERNEWGGVYAKCSCADCGLPRVEQPYTSRKEKK